MFIRYDDSLKIIEGAFPINISNESFKVFELPIESCWNTTMPKIQIGVDGSIFVASGMSSL